MKGLLEIWVRENGSDQGILPLLKDAGIQHEWINGNGSDIHMKDAMGNTVAGHHYIIGGTAHQRHERVTILFRTRVKGLHANAQKLYEFTKQIVNSGLEGPQIDKMRKVIAEVEGRE